MRKILHSNAVNNTAVVLGLLLLWILATGNVSAVKSLVTTGTLPTTTTSTTTTTTTTTSTTIAMSEADNSWEWVVPPENPCRYDPVTCVDDQSYYADMQSEAYYQDRLDWQRECWSEEFEGYRSYMDEIGILDEYCWDGHAGY